MQHLETVCLSGWVTMLYLKDAKIRNKVRRNLSKQTMGKIDLRRWEEVLMTTTNQSGMEENKIPIPRI